MVIALHIFETMLLVFLAAGCLVAGLDRKDAGFFVAAALFLLAAIVFNGSL